MLPPLPFLLTRVAQSSIFSLLGLIVEGDVGGMTIYTTRRMRKVWYPAAQPTSPPSPIQILMRNRWRAAAANWRALTEQQRQDYKRCIREQSMCMTGPALWTGLSCQLTDDLYQTIKRQSGIPLAQPIPV